MTQAASGARITALDVTRGFAVMGILAMNIIAFAWPEPVYMTPMAGGGASPADMAAWAVNYILIDSKMRGLFSMLFGASALLVMDRADAAGQNISRTHYARMAALALFGLLHYYLIWWGDILFLYAACGMLLLMFRNWSARALAITGAMLITLQAVFYGSALLAMRLAHDGGVASVAEEYDRFVGQFTAGSTQFAEQILVYRGDYAAILYHRLIEHGTQPFAGVAQFGIETLGLMLIGMALLKSGLLSGTWPIGRLMTWCGRCLGIGIIANLALLAWQVVNGLDAWVVVTATIVWSVPFDVVMSIGYAALFMGLAQRFAGSAIIVRVAAAGRAAFTNYLGTSVIMTFLFYGYGLGLFGEINRAACYLFVIATWALMLLWSKPWLNHYAYGPMEWLWRSLARWQFQRFRHSVSGWRRK